MCSTSKSLLIASCACYNSILCILSHCQAVCEVVALPDVCCTEQLSCQQQLLATVSAIIDKAGEESSIHSFILFYVLIHVMALQPEGSLQKEVYLNIPAR